VTKHIPADVQRRIYRLIGKASIALGLAILFVAGGLWGWRQYNRLRGEEEQAALSEFLLLASLTPEPTGAFQVPSSRFHVNVYATSNVTISVARRFYLPVIIKGYGGL